MTPIDRYAVIRGPALCTFVQGALVTKLLSQADVVIDYGLASADQEAAFAGTIESFRTAVSPTVSFTPLGLTGYFPLINALATLKVGQTMVGTLYDADGAGAGAAAMTDNRLIVQPLNTAEQQTTFYGVGVSAIPNLTFAADAPLFDSALTFRACGKNNVATDAAGRLFDKQANALADIGYDANQLIRQAYDITFAALNGGNAFSTGKGAKLAFNLKVNEFKGNSVGVYDIGFGGVQPVATLSPIGVTEADLLAALKIQGPGSAIGAKLSTSGGDLTITGTGVYCKIPLAGIRKASTVRGATADLLGDIEFVGAVAVSNDGSIAPRFVLATAAP